jgi:hypothetical protein
MWLDDAELDQEPSADEVGADEETEDEEDEFDEDDEDEEGEDGTDKDEGGLTDFIIDEDDEGDA